MPSSNKFGTEPLKLTTNSFLKSVIVKIISESLVLIEFFLTIPPTLILLVSSSDKFFISVGDLKYTTFSSKDLKTRKTVSVIDRKINNIKKALNLTFLPYMKRKS